MATCSHSSNSLSMLSWEGMHERFWAWWVKTMKIIIESWPWYSFLYPRMKCNPFTITPLPLHALLHILHHHITTPTYHNHLASVYLHLYPLKRVLLSRSYVESKGYQIAILQELECSWSRKFLSLLLFIGNEGEGEARGVEVELDQFKICDGCSYM